MAGWNDTGVKNFVAGAALAQYRRVRLASGVLQYAGASDADCIGTTRNAVASGASVAVILNTKQGTQLMVAASPVVAPCTVYAAANGMVDDTGTVEAGFALAAATALNDIIEVQVQNTLTPTTLARSVLTTDSLAEYQIPLAQMQTAAGAALGAGAGTPSGACGYTPGTFGTNSPLVVGEAASGNTKTDYFRFQFAMRPEYVAAGGVKIRLKAGVSVAATVSATAVVDVRKGDGAGAVSNATLVQVADQTAKDINSGTLANKDFAVTATGFAVGDLIDVKVTLVTTDTGGTTGAIAQVGKVSVLADVKG